MSKIPNLRRFSATRPVRDERGIALVLALIVLLILSISAGTAVGLITSNQNVSSHERQGVQAGTGGEAGLDLAANWVLANDSSTPTLNVGTVHTQSNVPVANNNVSWTATKTSASKWTLDSTTTSPNGKVTRQLEEAMQSETIPGTPAPFWGYGFVMGGQPNPGSYNPLQICDQGLGSDTPTVFGGSGQVNVPMWVGGDVCTSGGDSPIANPTSGSPITVHIGGFLYGTNGPSYIVGAPGNPVANFEALGFCWDKHTSSGTVPIPCDRGGVATTSGNSGVYSSLWGPIGQTVTPPSLDNAGEQAIYATASPGPMNPCGPSSTGTIPANLFDSAGSTTADSSLVKGSNTIDDLLGANAFDCKTANGDLSWTPPVSRGAKSCLHVTGSKGVFFDADVSVPNGQLVQIDTNGINACTGATYADGPSNGSIYFDGGLHMDHNGSICSHEDFNSTGTICVIPATGATIPRVFFSFYNRSNTLPGFSMQGSNMFESSAYVRDEFAITAGTGASAVGGSVFASYASVTGGTSFSVTDQVPAGALGSATTTTTWQIAPGTWRQCPVSGCTALP